MSDTSKSSENEITPDKERPSLDNKRCLSNDQSADEKPSTSVKSSHSDKTSHASPVAGPSQEKKRKQEVSDYETKQAVKKHQKQEEERMKMQ